MAPPPIPAPRRWWQTMRHSLWYVVGYDWLVSATVLPFALLIVWLFAVKIPKLAMNPWEPVPVSLLCVSGYICFEVTAFCLERNWSQVSFWRFWRVAVGPCIVFTCLSLLLTWADMLGCLLFLSICLGFRETIFELQSAFPDVGKYFLKDRLTKEHVTACFFGGSCYGTAVAFCCAAGGAMMHAVAGRGKQVLSTVLLEVLCALGLPLSRCLCRMLLSQLLGGVVLASGAENVAAASGSTTLAPTPRARSGRPVLDSLLLYSDVLYLLTMFVEVPYAFVFLLVPHTITFAVAASVNVVFDFVFVQALDIKHRQRCRAPKASGGPPPPGTAPWPVSEAGGGSPTYCLERRESAFLALADGMLVPQTTETTSLVSPPESTGSSQWIAGRRLWERISSAASRCYSSSAVCCTRCCPSLLRWFSASEEEPELMSPRISQLMDDYDEGVILWTEPNKGFSAYFHQGWKIAVTTHLLGSTMALIFAVVLVPVLGLHSRVHLWGNELLYRSLALIGIRIITDLAACHNLERAFGAAADLQGSAYARLWESRQELRTPQCWAFRVLAGICPLFAVVGGTLT
mmetsp:Transcript_116668/g.206403  ORF Transcript_116668/g.206403 Transcript_116668/m.206403 type:complete len:573 (-) Transcript_116668:113-1831(-)